MTYIPTWTNLTLGNGTDSASYILDKGIAKVWDYVLFGSTSSIGGAISCTLPIGSALVAWFDGQTRVDDNSTSAVYSGPTTMGAAVVYPGVTDASSTYLSVVSITSTVPMTWATNDKLRWQVTYATK